MMPNMAPGTLAMMTSLVLMTSFHASATKKNVLFLVSDDMRPEIGAYLGPDFPTSVHPRMHTPSLDRLAASSLLLKRAYVQQAVCAPSRTSLLTGRRPDTTRVHDLVTYWRTVAGNFTTIPQYFKESGYVSAGLGKIFHPGLASNDNDPMSWTEKYFVPDQSHWQKHRGTTWYAADVDETKKFPLVDMQTADHAVETLKRLAPKALSGEQPFFVAVGIHKPHLPWLFPANFLDYYPEDDIKLPKNPYAPVDMPQAAWSDFDELRAFSDINTTFGYGGINTTYPDYKVRELRRSYYAALSYADSLIGQVLDALDSLGLANSTVVSFWGDHGWQLGEHGEWAKHTNFELATHAPMMLRVPGLTDSGLVTERLTEFVDLFPTLADAAGLAPIPLCPDDSRTVATCTEGVSLMPLVRDPVRPWKSGAFSQYPRMLCDGNIIMGYRIRTDRYSYTDWVFYDPRKYGPLSKGSRGTELYDHRLDPDENVNRANDPQYKDIAKRLRKKLEAGWRKALPPQNQLQLQ